MINMGLGQIGGRNIIHKRKFRWTFAIDFPDADIESVPTSFVKTSARPNIDVEEQEINFLNGKTWIPGKGVWQTINITYYDVNGDGDNPNLPLWSWLANVYDYTNSTTLRQNSKRECYAGVGTLVLYDGCGEGLEQWELRDAWPKAIDFGELDYANSEEVTVSVTLRYSDVNYTNLCGSQPTVNCCTCSGASAQ